MKKILIAGFGDVAERLVRGYAGQADFIGLVRRPERIPELRALGVTPFVYNHPYAWMVNAIGPNGEYDFSFTRTITFVP